MRLLFLVFVVGLAACSSVEPVGSTITATSQPSTTTTVETTTTATLPPECPTPPYEVGVLPARAALDRPPSSEQVVLDQFTTIAGTSATIWVDAEGNAVMALVRGSLPPEQWPGDRGEVFIDGARGVAGPFADGTWVVAWFEEPGDRCDRYMAVFYPPVEPTEVQATIESMNRVAG
jgi:hypothetical protein